MNEKLAALRHSMREVSQQIITSRDCYIRLSELASTDRFVVTDSNDERRVVLS